MTGDEGVVDALPRLGEAPQAPELPEGAEERPPPRQRLVDVALVAHVEDQPVPVRVEHPVDRHRQLHRAQVRRQMPPRPGYALNQKLAQLPAKQ